MDGKAERASRTRWERQTLCVLAPGKVNLTLRVLGRREDGYHEIETLMLAVNLFDRLRLTKGAGRLRVTGPAAQDIPEDETNLVLVAARKLAGRLGRQLDVDFLLEKHVPAGRGLGGGSSDAAAALWGLQRYWGLSLPAEELAGIGAEVGSDVAFFFHTPSAICRGRGEKVEPVRASWPGPIVLVLPAFAVSTADVYAALARLTGRKGAARVDVAAVERGRLGECERLLFNDLEPAAWRVEPRLAEVARSIWTLTDERSGVGGPHLSGSGSAYYVLAEGQEAAEKLRERLTQRGLDARVVGACAW